MSIAIFLKNNLKYIPPQIGIQLNKIPYSKRPGIGEIYKKRQTEINTFNCLQDSSKKKDFIFQRMYEITNYAYEFIPFYKKHYTSHNFSPKNLKNFNDLQKIPVIDKDLLRACDIEDRSKKTKGRYIVNTGGSSGTPFSLYIEPCSMGHEWAHMHHIWEQLDYKSSDLKLVFGGRSDLRDAVEYDVVRNHFAIDIYADYRIVAERLKRILNNYNIKYLHGYPSSIYDFALYCKNHDPELKLILSKMLIGVFLGSEYPQPLYRRVIEETFNIKSVSWYGHTERCVLAYEKSQPFIYEPFQTYGFAEAVISDNENEFNLVSTSYYNFASPLIRYNTKDIITEVNVTDGILNSFQVTKGREGEYVIDKTGKRINLTGLIFGRHHEIFNYSKFIQVKQLELGEIEIHFVSGSVSEQKAHDLFDLNNLNFDVKFVKREEPFRTTSGKINLLIK